MTNNISTNVTSTVSINFDNKKVRHKMDCYIFHTFLLLIILLFIIAIICDNDIKQNVEQNKIVLVH